MDKFWYFLLGVLFLVGCENFGKKKYLYVETVRLSGSGSLHHLDPKEIYADDDTSAYREAVERFDISIYVANDMASKGEDYERYISFPQKFTLTDAKGNLISFPEIKSDVIKNLYPKDTSGQNKAFEGAEFGMTIDDVKKLGIFNPTEWSYSDNSITNSSYSIGGKNYKVSLIFNSDSLYLVTFTSTYGAYLDASYLQTSIKDEVVNFKTVIQKAYGYPEGNKGVPSILDLNAGYITWAYMWKIGTKRINVGIEEKYSGSLYRMFAEIYDANRYNAIQELKKKNKDTIQGDAASKF